MRKKPQILRKIIIVLGTLGCGVIWLPLLVEFILRHYVSQEYFYPPTFSFWILLGLLLLVVSLPFSLWASVKRRAIGFYGLACVIVGFMVFLVPFMPSSLKIPPEAEVERIYGYRSGYRGTEEWEITNPVKIREVTRFLKQHRWPAFMSSGLESGPDWVFQLYGQNGELAHVSVREDSIGIGFWKRSLSNDELYELWELVYARDDPTAVRGVSEDLIPSDVMDAIEQLGNLETNLLVTLEYVFGMRPESDWNGVRDRLEILLLRHGVEAEFEYAPEYSSGIRLPAFDPPPMRIHLEQAPTPQWLDSDAVASLVEDLITAGFTEVGTFRIREMPSILMAGLVNSEDRVGAFICQLQSAGIWVDVFVEYENGDSLTVSSAALGGLLDPMPSQVMIYEHGEGDIRRLLDKLRLNRDTGRCIAITSDNLVEIVEESYAEVTQWRAERGGATEEEVRRVAESQGYDLSDELVQEVTMAVHEQWQASVAEWHGEGADRVLDETIDAESLQRGNECFEAGQYLAAATLFEQLVETTASPAIRGKALFNLGLTQEALTLYDEAIATFGEVLASDVDDQEPGDNLMQIYRNYRPRAQWEAARCHFLLENYTEALEAYRVAEHTYPFQTWCGNELAENAFRNAFRQALCHEHLGDFRTALQLYYSAIVRGGVFYSDAVAHRRIVDIYETTGHIDELEQMLDEFSDQIAQEFRSAFLGEPERAEVLIKRANPFRQMIRVLELRQLERQEDWSALISVLQPETGVFGPEYKHGQSMDWEAAAAAELLAQYPEATVPLLMDALGLASSVQAKWIAYTLGRSESELGIEMLERIATSTRGPELSDSVIYALSLSGLKGQQAIDRLAQRDNADVRMSIHRYRVGDFDADDENLRFAELPTDAPVPLSLAEWAELSHAEAH